MTRLICARGLPASGKSTAGSQWLSCTPMAAIVSRDMYREHVFGFHGMAPKEQEAAISLLEKAQARTLLKQGFDVYVDAQNLRMSYLKVWKQLALSEGADFEIQDFTHVGVEECVRRNAERLRPVPEDYIRSQHEKFIRGKRPITADEVQVPPPHSFLRYEKEWGLSPAYIFDVDGTLAHHGDRSPYDFTRVDEDERDDDVATLADILDFAGLEIVVVSGRSEECREATEKWLTDHGVCYSELFMRAAGDFRPDTVVKDEIFENNIRGRWNVFGVFDDRRSVVKMWRAKGIKCFQVEDGDF